MRTELLFETCTCLYCKILRFLIHRSVNFLFVAFLGIELSRDISKSSLKRKMLLLCGLPPATALFWLKVYKQLSQSDCSPTGFHLITTVHSKGSKCCLFHMFVAALPGFPVFFMQLNKLKSGKLVVNGLQEQNGLAVFVPKLLSNLSE